MIMIMMNPEVFDRNPRLVFTMNFDRSLPPNKWGWGGGGELERGYGPCHRISGDIEQIAVKVKEKMVAQDKTAWGRGMLQAYLKTLYAGAKYSVHSLI